jgi:2-dehydropantoate 2-reductase
MKRVCIAGAGAGAIGGFLGARLATAGEVEVGALARGATLAVLRMHGWCLHTAQGLVGGPARPGSAACRRPRPLASA